MHTNPFDIQHPLTASFSSLGKIQRTPLSDWDEERSARGATQLDDRHHDCHHPLGSAITGGAGLLREGHVSCALPIMNASELDALHRPNVALYLFDIINEDMRQVNSVCSNVDLLG